MKSRVLRSLFFVLSCSLTSAAQMSTASFTLHDPTGQVFANGTVSYSISPLGSYTFNGAPLDPSYNTPQIVSLDSTGHGSFTVPRNDKITPFTSTWKVVACSNTTAPCTTAYLILNQATQDISATINALIPPIVVPLGNIARAYTDAQVMASGTSLDVGSVYFNVGTATPGHRYWTGSSFAPLGGGGSPGVTAINGTTGGFTFNFGSGAGNCTSTTCTFTGGGSTPTGPQYKAGVYNSGGGPSYNLGNATWGTDASGNNLIVPSGVVNIGASAGSNTTQDLFVSDSGQNHIEAFQPNAGSYAVYRWGSPSQVWQIAMGGSATGGLANKLYFYDQTNNTSILTFTPNSGDAALKGGFFNTPNDTAFNLGGSGAYSSSARKYLEDRTAYAIYNGGAYGSSFPQTQGFYDYSLFKGLGHIWRGSTQTIGATTQSGRYFTYQSETPGQSIANTGTITCLSDGDCISDETFMYGAGNGGQENAENTHAEWFFMRSPGDVGFNNCVGVCGTPNASTMLASLSAGQYSIIADLTDKQTATIASPVFAVGGMPFTGANLSGITLPVSKIFQINEAVAIDQNVTAASAGGTPWQPTSVVVSINTSPYYTGALTTTASLSTNGVGCLANPPTWTGLSNEQDSREEYEPVFYQVVDSTHLRLWTTLVRSTNSIFAVGGACGMGLEQKAQSDAQGLPTVYPIIASLSSTKVIIAGGGLTGFAPGMPGIRNFENGSGTITQVSRSGTTATITVGSSTGVVGGLNGKRVTISGMTADAALNGTFTIISNGVANQYTYTAGSGTIAPISQSGSFTSGDTVANIYPIALVLVPWNPNQPNVNGWFLTAPYTFSSNAMVFRSAPYYSQFSGKAIEVTPNEDQFLGPVGSRITLGGGSARQEVPGIGGSPYIGLDILNSDSPYGTYQGYGGTYLPPDYAISITGTWQRGINFRDAGILGMFFDNNDLPPGATSWSYCPFATVSGASFCGGDTVAGGHTYWTLSVGSANWQAPSGPSAFEINPGNNLNEGVIKSHSPTIIAPDHAHSSLWSLEVDAPTSFTEALKVNGYINLTNLQSGLTCADFLGVDSSGNVGLFNPGCSGGGGGSGTVNSGTATQAAFYATTGTAVSGTNHLLIGSTQNTMDQPLVISGTSNGEDLPAAPLPTPLTSAGGIYSDPSGNIEIYENGGSFFRVCTAGNGVCGGGIADFTVAITSGSQGANSCSSGINVTVTGLTTSMVLVPGYSADPTTITSWSNGGGMTFYIWPSATNQATWKVCNSLGTTNSYGAITFNVGVK